MKTRDELWRWIWEDDEVLDQRALAVLLDEEGEGGPPAPPPPAPAIRTDDLWEWLTRDEPLLDEDPLGEADQWVAPPEPDVRAPYAEPAEFLAPAPEVVEAPVWAEAEAAPRPQPSEELEPQVAPFPPRRIRRTSARSYRFAALIVVAAVGGAVAPQVLPVGVRPEAPEGTQAAPPEQTVVAWAVADDDSGLTFTAVLAAGVRPPVALAVPADVTISLPGQGLGTMRDAAWTGKPGFVEVAMENLLGVPVDASVVMTAPQLAAAVDGVGGIVVADQPMDGAAAVAYLTAPQAAELPDERFLRWQDVLDAFGRSVAARPEAVAALPEGLRPVMAASGSRLPDLLSFPVVDIGAGVLRPDEEAAMDLISERFVQPGGDEVRLVVLNGVGEPGIGEEVARILIPNGFRLMSSENANRFDYKVTRIVAASEEDLPSAERARDLLGVGQILLGAQPQLTDVIVVVGRDFAGGR